ncbi:MAG: Lrp/AsnC family transcriptional regulator, partial [Nanoarchaeota archaeon]|nr:Lrp/AsnC family transcriptional regulator [Nanoarchaeota archaeon]
EIFQEKILGKIKLNHISKFKEKKLNKIDLQILSLLSQNSRIEYKKISSKLNLTGNAIKFRIKNLENSGIISGYTLSIDIKKLGYNWYNLQVKEINSNDLELKKFLRENKKVIYFYKYLGNENWDIDMGLIIKDPEELREFILELREKFGSTTKIHDLYIIVEESKSNSLPQGVFENP